MSITAVFCRRFKHTLTTFAIDDLQLTYDKKDNQGSDSVFLTRVYRGKITPVRKLIVARKKK